MMKKDLERFRKDGENLKKAKFFNNVIDDNIYNIPINQVKYF